MPRPAETVGLTRIIQRAPIMGPTGISRAYSPDARIWRGERDGQLTPDEAHRLAHRERHLDNLTRKAQADGKVTPHEARHLRNLADRDNRAIWRLGHNGAAGLLAALRLTPRGRRAQDSRATPLPFRLPALTSAPIRHRGRLPPCCTRI